MRHRFRPRRLRGYLALLVISLTMALGEANAQDLPPAQPPAPPPEPKDIESQPLWEAGVGGVIAYQPDYPAAGQSHVKGLPFPYFVYRGKFFQVTERGRLRGILLDTRRIELDLSAAGSFAADSDDNRARRGMPDLDWLGEIGPRLGINLLPDDQHGRLRLDLNLRGVFSTDLESFGFQGYVFSPDLVWQKPDIGIPGLDLTVRLSSIFATERFQDYFYEVRAQYARDDRREYDAKPGYLGTYLDVGLRYPLTSRIRGTVGTRIGYFEGAANEGSPLFRDDLTVGVGGLAHHQPRPQRPPGARATGRRGRVTAQGP